MRRKLAWMAVVVLLLAAAPPLWAQGQGRIEGQIARPDGHGLGGVTVVVEGVGRAAITDAGGRFSFSNVPAGTHTVTFTLGDNTVSTEVEVLAGGTAMADQTVDWDATFVETITVFSASRQTERITEAPAAITVIPIEQIEREGSHGQVPKLLEFTPGAEVTQSGLYDFNFNARGFNSSLNRRILTLIDGRDPSVPFLGSQEWAAVSFPLDDLASVELVRGPGSALYGADAFNGVLNMTTKAPRYSQGGKVQLSGGDLDTRRFDLRAAGEIGGGWYWKVTGGHMESEDFAVSRNVASGGPEYRPCSATVTTGCLTPEPVPLATQEDKLTFYGARLDKYFGDGAVFTLEGGNATIEGPVAQTGIGRVQLLDIERPWARANFNTEHWNVLAYYNSRDAADQLALRSGATLVLDSDNWVIEVQGNTNFAGDRGRLVGGVSYKEENIDSANSAGFQTLMFGARSEDFSGVFGQVEYNLTDALKAVVAARWDDSSLHDSQVSPRGSLVWAVTPDHTLRFTYAEAFQTPNYSEFFLRAPVAPPLTALSALEQALAPFLGGVPLGFDSVPILALGNPSLEVEQIQSYEVGYTGIFGRRSFVTLDYYKNDIDNFVTDLITAFQPSLGGNINPSFGPYAPPSALPAPVQQIILTQLRAALGPTFALLSNAPDGSPIIAAVSYVNFGQVETQGIELGVHHHFSQNWTLDFTYNWFDFDVQQELPDDPVIPNTAEHKYSVGLAYVAPKFDASVRYRWVDDFDWNAGVFRGPVPSYDVVNLTANYHFNDSWGIGVDVSNLLDDEHYEAFGGDLLGRRALGFVNYSW